MCGWDVWFCVAAKHRRTWGAGGGEGGRKCIDCGLPRMQEAGEHVGKLRNAMGVLRAQHGARMAECMGRGRDKGLLGRVLGRMAGGLLGEKTTESRRMVGACLELHLRKRVGATVMLLWSEVARNKAWVNQQSLAKREKVRRLAMQLVSSQWRRFSEQCRDLRRRATSLQRKREQCWMLDVLASWVEGIAVKNEKRLLAREEAAAAEYFSRKFASDCFAEWRLAVVDAVNSTNQ